LVALGTECSAAERGGDGAARHPYLCFVAPGRSGPEISWLNLKRFTYHFVYRELADGICVMLVRHHRRNPRFGMERE